MIDEQREEQASLYALGALPAAELADFEQALRSDPELQSLVSDLQATADTLALATPRVQPPAHLKQEILSRLESRQKIVPLPVPESTWPILVPWALAASLAVACVILYWQGQRLGHQSAELRRQLDDVSRRAEALRGQSDTFQKQLAVLDTELKNWRDKDALAEMKIALLASLLEKSPKAVSVSVWDKDKQDGVLVVRDLAPLPVDKDYQLWVIDARAPSPISAGVFSVDDKGNVRFKFKPVREIGAADKFAISMERKGGVPNPTMDQIVMMGN